MTRLARLDCVARLGLVLACLAVTASNAAEVRALEARRDDLPADMELAPLPRTAPVPPEAPKPSTAVVELGRLLFFDPVLSSTREVSCATCHDPRWGWADGRPLPIGVGGRGNGPARVASGEALFPPLTRNTPSLLDVAFNGLTTGKPCPPDQAPMFWDARTTGLERQVAFPIGALGEMRADDCPESQALPRALERVRAIPGYEERFAAAFGPGAGATQVVTADRLARAIATFERTLVTAPTPVDRFLSGDASALDATQQRGLRVFREAGCQHCHGGPMFSDFKLHVGGVPDPTPGGQRAFRTPTLRNLRHTAPYLHNGSLRTLGEVLAFYDNLADAVAETLDGGVPASGPALDPLLKHLSLRPEDFPALEAFLDALSTSTYDQTRPDSVPSGLAIAGDPQGPGRRSR